MKIRLRVLSVLGSRPEVIQAGPLAVAFASRFDEILLDTGQHYDWEMAAGQVADTRLPQPAYSLGIGSLPDGEQLRAFEDAIGGVIESERPHAVVVRGDTNSTLAGARAAKACGVPLVHVEAGMRSYRSDMPEERNRIETDRLADLNCAPTEAAAERLRAEGVAGTVVTTGDVLFDMLRETRDRLPPRAEEGAYVLATVHRNYNTDDAARLSAVLECLAVVPSRVILPLHPRTRERLGRYGLDVPANVECRRPTTYTEMLALERDAEAIVTDSGGVQREAYFWGVPCVTLREETEWTETVESGWNTLAAADSGIVAAALAAAPPAERPPLFGDGHAAEHICDAMLVLLDRPGGEGMSDVVRVGVIGAGRMGALHVTTYQRMENVRLVAVADPTPAARIRALRGATGVHEYDDWRDLLERDASSLDAVSVSCPSSLHAEVALAALEHGLHVLVEKPIATTLPDALRMRAAARDAGRKLMVGHVERFNPAVAKLRELVRAGRLGDIFRIQATRVGPSPFGAPDTGVVLDLASHDLDVMQHVLGQDITQVIATGGSFQHGAHEDLVTCMLRFADGALGLLDANWVSPEKQREVVLLGSAGSLRANYITQDVWFVESSSGKTPGWEELAFIRGEGEGAATRFGLHKVEPIRAELDAFVDCIVNDTPEPISAHDGARALAAALAIRESLRSGRAVRLLEMPQPQTARPFASLS